LSKFNDYIYPTANKKKKKKRDSPRAICHCARALHHTVSGTGPKGELQFSHHAGGESSHRSGWFDVVVIRVGDAAEIVGSAWEIQAPQTWWWQVQDSGEWSARMGRSSARRVLLGVESSSSQSRARWKRSFGVVGRECFCSEFPRSSNWSVA
jgi:hypothetical protein